MPKISEKRELMASRIAMAGAIRKHHMAVGAGIHKIRSNKPYIFSRVLHDATHADKVLVGIELNKGEKVLPTYSIFNNGDVVKDYYSNTLVTVEGGKVVLNTPYEIVLLGEYHAIN